MSTQRSQGIRPAIGPAVGIPDGATRPSRLSPLTSGARLGLRIAMAGLASGWLVLLATGCGGGGSSSGPTAPTIANVAGNWTGTYAAESASGCGCVGDLFQTIIGVPLTLTMEIQQNGSTFEGRLTDEDGVWCDLEGTVGSEAFNAEFTSCSETDPGEVECRNGIQRYVAWGRTTLQGTVIGNRMTGTVLEEDECFTSNKDEFLGVLTVRLGIDLQRG